MLKSSEPVLYRDSDNGFGGEKPHGGLREGKTNKYRRRATLPQLLRQSQSEKVAEYRKLPVCVRSTEIQTCCSAETIYVADLSELTEIQILRACLI